MPGFFLRLLIIALGLWLADALLDGVSVTGTFTLLLAALLLGFVNAVVRSLFRIPGSATWPRKRRKTAFTTEAAASAQTEWVIALQATMTPRLTNWLPTSIRVRRLMATRRLAVKKFVELKALIPTLLATTSSSPVSSGWW